MFLQILVGTCLLVTNITIAAIAAMVMELAFLRLHPWLLRPPHRPKLVLLLAGVSVAILAVITVAVWVWAIAFWYLEGFATLEEALYFALVAFTTLGLGDGVLPHAWRILAGMAAANGFLHFSLLTALLIEALRQVRLAQWQHRGMAQPLRPPPDDAPKAG